MTLFGKKKIFAEEINLRLLTRDHPGLTGWVLNPMAGDPIRVRQREIRQKRTTHRKGHTRTRQGWSHAATSQGAPGAAQSCMKQRGFSPEPPEGVRPGNTLVLDF